MPDKASQLLFDDREHPFVESAWLDVEKKWKDDGDTRRWVYETGKKKKKEKGKKRKKRKREICEADGHCSVKNGAMMEAGRWNILRRLFCYFFTPRLMSVKCASR